MRIYFLHCLQTSFIFKGKKCERNNSTKDSPKLGWTALWDAVKSPTDIAADLALPPANRYSSWSHRYPDTNFLT